MIYLFDTYYSKKIDFVNAIKVSSAFASKFCSFYEAEVIFYEKNFKGLKERRGKLPTTNKEEFVTELIEWILNSSLNDELFKLLMYSDANSPKETCIFDHHDDTCCWALNLTEDQFEGLQRELETNDLPIDLFYESSKSICIKEKGIKGLLGFKKSYTPKEYEIYRTVHS